MQFLAISFSSACSGVEKNDQRREDLLQDVAVFLEHQAEELLGVVCHQVDFEAIMNPRFLDGFVARLQAYDFFERQKMYAAQVVIGIRRREAVKMRPR